MFEQLHCPMSYAVYKFQPEIGDFSACCDATSYKFDAKLFDELGGDYFEKHPKLVERKQALYDNIKHSDCSQCWIKEEQGLNSMRMELGPHQPELFNNRTLDINSAYPSRFELWMNSTCNLGCFMCHIGNSNTLRKIWYTDFDSYGNDGKGYDVYINEKQYTRENYQPKYTEAMLNFIVKHIKNLESYALNIAYLGGEPTLHHEMYEHADLFIEAGREAIKAGKELKIEITTNGTSKDKLNERFYRMYERYKQAGWSTRIMVSQDGANEYAQVRHGADFQQIAQNYGNWLKPDSVVDEVTSFTVVSAINLPYIDQMADYINDAVRNNYRGNKKIAIRFNTLIDPKWMRVENLPRHYAESSISHARRVFTELQEDYPNLKYNYSLFENIAETLKETIQPDKVENFFERIDYTNSIYQKTYPEWDFYKQFPFLTEYRKEYGI